MSFNVNELCSGSISNFKKGDSLIFRDNSFSFLFKQSKQDLWDNWFATS